MRALQANLLVNRDALSLDTFLLDVTCGSRGEIVALSADRNPWDMDWPEPPFTYTVACWRDGTSRTVRLEGIKDRLTLAQSCGVDRFLLVSPWAGGIYDPNNAIVVGPTGDVEERFCISIGVEHVQYDLAGDLWVGYFDEGVFRGHGLSREGLICLSAARSTFRFNSLAHERGLPPIADCYALNVASGHDVYVCYYAASDYFPLVHLRDGEVANFWRVGAVLGAHALAVDGGCVLLAQAYGQPERLTVLDLATGDAEEVVATDASGQPVAFGATYNQPLASPPAWGRGSVLYLLDAQGIWTVTVPRSPAHRGRM